MKHTNLIEKTTRQDAKPDFHIFIKGQQNALVQ